MRMITYTCDRCGRTDAPIVWTSDGYLCPPGSWKTLPCKCGECRPEEAIDAIDVCPDCASCDVDAVLAIAEDTVVQEANTPTGEPF